MERCSQGHFYDEQKYTLCPYCGVGGLAIPATQAKRPEIPAEIPPTTPYVVQEETTPKTVASAKSVSSIREPGETIGMVRRKTGMDPVVGWLVCIQGPEKGRDYRIRSEKNSIGRSEKNDIFISGDDTISRENHAYIVYNPKNFAFRVQTGDSRGLVYLNNEEVMTYMELKPYDVIEIGETKLAFIPFCGERFQWV